MSGQRKLADPDEMHIKNTLKFLPLPFIIPLLTIQLNSMHDAHKIRRWQTIPKAIPKVISKIVSVSGET